MNQIELKELANGAMQEKAQKAIEEVIENMQDPNTPWKNKREVIIKMKFTQNEDRDDATCEISVDKKTAPIKPVETKFSIGKDLRTGEVFAEEYGPQIKGQMNMSDYVDEDTGEIHEETGKVVDYRKKEA
ncbi:hypothetical protein KTH81_15080 [Lachnospiraceae bacterium ASD3451]|uniref:hypothetical protein n=1 Tax=Diplocloster agilis TaxID=2850323 RepID=UPI001D4E776F|nr:hypothetical protein [Diplocloster agilis]MBU9745145.1 hypothetical protein [Diplocloster agilis]DAE53267.1 MAG TPA: hypothetical protein [Caudoviricetes sp.]